MAEDLKQLDGKEEPFANRNTAHPGEEHAMPGSTHSIRRDSPWPRNTILPTANYAITIVRRLASRRDLSLFQVNFYGFIQEFILRDTGQQRGAGLIG